MKRKMIKVRVQTGASSSRIKQVGKGSYKVWTTNKPIKGKANEAVVEVISDELGVAKSLVCIKSGHRSRDKVLEILA